MKKLKLLLSGILVLALLTGNAFAFSNNQIEVNGNLENLNKTLISNEENVFISVRELAGILGYTVEWNSEERAVSLKKESNEYLLWPNSNIVKMDTYNEVKLTSKTFIQDGTLYIPLNSVVDVFDLKLERGIENYELGNGLAEVSGSAYSLDTLYDMAVENSEALRTAEENVERYEITEEQAKEDLSGAEPFDTGNSNQDAARLGAYQNYYAQGIGLEITERSVEVTKEKIRHELSTALETIAIELDNLELVELSLDVNKINYDQGKLKFELGLISSLDLDALRISYESAVSTVQMQKLTLENSWISLNEMIGLPSDSRINFDYNFSFEQMVDRNLNGHISDVLNYSPAIWNLEQQIKLAENSVNFYVFNTGSTPYDAEKIDLTLAKINLKSAKDAMEEGLKTTFNSIVTLEENAGSLDLQVNKSLNDLKLAQQNLEVGLATELQVKGAKLALKQAENSVLKNISTYLSTVRLYDKPWIAQ